MRPWLLFLCSILAFATGAVQMGNAIAFNHIMDPSSPWFFLGMLAAFTGSALVRQERRLRALEDELARFQTSRAESVAGHESTRRDAFCQALAKVPPVEPAEEDRW
jgi:hypothetical protein